MGIFTRADSPFYWVWIEGAARPRVNTKIPIGATPALQRENRKLADQVYTALMGDRARARFRLPDPARDGRTFKTHREWYQTHVTPQKRGQVRELSMLTQLGAFFDASALAAIDTELALEWRTWRLQTVAAATVHREEAVLRHLLKTAVPKYIDHHPLLGTGRLRIAPTDTRILTTDEEDRLLAALKTDEDRALVTVALDTLLRLSNVAALSRSQDHGTYLFSDTKVGAVRIPISKRVRLALDRLNANRGAAYFPTYARRPARAALMFTAALARADIATGRKTGGVSFHCLRHTGASRMLEAGADVKTVMEIGGWKNLRVMERYLHPTDAAKRRAVEAIGRRRGKLALVSGRSEE
jgi:integrase